MKAFAGTMLLFGTLATCGSQAAAEAPYVDTVNGFRLVPPAFGPSDTLGVTSQPVTFMGPAVGGMAPSCNVQIQNLGVKPAKYRELSRNQFEALGLAVESEAVRKVSGKEATLWRFSGAGATAMALAVYSGDQVFLLTCMAGTQQFKKNEKSFQATIDSFSLEARE